MNPQVGQRAQAPCTRAKVCVLLALLLAGLSACDGARSGHSKSSVSNVASDEPAAPECEHLLDGNEGLVLLPGTYRAGDDQLDETLEIRADGTYLCDNRGCGIGERGRDRYWRQRGSKIVFMQGLRLLDKYREGVVLVVGGQLAVHVEQRSRECLVLTREAEGLSKSRDLGE